MGGRGGSGTLATAVRGAVSGIGAAIGAGFAMAGGVTGIGVTASGVMGSLVIAAAFGVPSKGRGFGTGTAAVVFGAATGLGAATVSGAALGAGEI